MIEIFVTAYALSLDVKEKKTLIVYTVLHRLSFLYVLDIIRMLSQLEETLHYPMKWEKMDHQGIEIVSNVRSVSPLVVESDRRRVG